MEEKYVAFVKVFNLKSHNDEELEKIETTINEILGGDAIYTFPVDPSVKSDDIPAVVEVTFFKASLIVLGLEETASLLGEIKRHLEKILGQNSDIFVILLSAKWMAP